MVDVGITSGQDLAVAGFSAREEASARAAKASRELFAAAERHSRRVRTLRRVIPMVCVAAVFLGLVGRFFMPSGTPAEEEPAAPMALQGSRLTMEQPKVSGFRKDSKAYEMIADVASQDVRRPNIVDMKLPVARIEMDQGSWTRLTAQIGSYDSTTEKLVATENVRVRTENGMELRMKQANVDFKAGTVVSTTPVEVDLPNGWIRANTLRIIDNGKSAIFEGQVRSEFRDVEQSAGTATNPASVPPNPASVTQ